MKAKAKAGKIVLHKDNFPAFTNLYKLAGFTGEAMLYNKASSLTNYTGGLWGSASIGPIKDGLIFPVVPHSDLDDLIDVESPMNWFSGKMTVLSFSAALWIIFLNNMAWKCAETDPMKSNKFSDLFYKFKDACFGKGVFTSEEASKIARLID